jgi:hypothetical protein
MCVLLLSFLLDTFLQNYVRYKRGKPLTLYVVVVLDGRTLIRGQVCLSTISEYEFFAST